MSNINNLHDLHECFYYMLMDIDNVCKKHNIKYSLAYGTALGAIRHHDFIPWDDDVDIQMLRDDYEKFLLIAPQELGTRYYVQKGASSEMPLLYSKIRLNNTCYLEKKRYPITTHQGVFIDVFPIDNCYNFKPLRKTQFFLEKIWRTKLIHKYGFDNLKHHSPKDFFLKFLCLWFPIKIVRSICVAKKKSSSLYCHCFYGGEAFSKCVMKRRIFAKTTDFLIREHSFPVWSCYDEYLKNLYGNYMEVPPISQRDSGIHAEFFSLTKDYKEFFDDKQC